MRFSTHVSRVRNKLELLPAHGWRLVSVYGYGYRLLRLEGAAAGAAKIPVGRVSAAPPSSQAAATAVSS